MTLLSHIEANFKVLWPPQEQEQPLTEADNPTTFLLAEAHGFENTRRINSAFISTFATPGSVFLKEGWESLKPSPDPLDPFIKTSNITTILGWDIKEMVNYNIWKICIEIAAIAVFWLEEPTSNYKSLLMQKFQERYEQIPLVVRQHTDLLSIGDREMSLLAKELEKFYTGEVLSLESRISDHEALLKSAREEIFERGALPLLDPVYKRFMDEHAELLFLRLSIRQQKRDEFLGRVSCYFRMKDRTNAMVATLSAITSYVQEGGRAFLVAGLRHLEEDREDVEETRLTALYEFLKGRRDIVVLIPKSLT